MIYVFPPAEAQETLDCNTVVMHYRCSERDDICLMSITSNHWMFARFSSSERHKSVTRSILHCFL